MIQRRWRNDDRLLFFFGRFVRLQGETGQVLWRKELTREHSYAHGHSCECAYTRWFSAHMGFNRSANSAESLRIVNSVLLQELCYIFRFKCVRQLETLVTQCCYASSLHSSTFDKILEKRAPKLLFT